MGGALDADEMRRRAAECRLFAKTAVPCAAGDEWLEAAEHWEQLAREFEVWQARCAPADRVAKVKDDKAP